MNVVLDTHALIWLLEGEGQLGLAALQLADEALKDDSLLVSAMSFWEVAMLSRRNRLEVGQPIGVWRRSVLENGVIEIPVSGDIGILSTELEGFHQDLADRIITATALVHGATLITADQKILSWPGSLLRHTAET